MPRALQRRSDETIDKTWLRGRRSGLQQQSDQKKMHILNTFFAAARFVSRRRTMAAIGLS
jgi:hypothetical protein